MTADRLKQIRHRLKETGLRCTRARLDILEALCETARPVTHGELMEALDGLHRVTLYRNLASLEAARLVHRVQGTDGIWRYRAHVDCAAGCPGNHPHFLCLSCGKMFCLDGPPMPWVQVPPGARIQGKQFLVYGLCEPCNK